MPEVPPRLLRRGRPVDPDFDPDEDLYRACTREEVHVDRLLPERISFRDWSLNRGKYSDPTDVLIGRDGFGIATFKARDVPARLNSQSGIAFDFRLEHAPQEDNY